MIAKNRKQNRRSALVAALTLTATVLGVGAPAGNATAGSSQELLNVSYDPTRELWRDINSVFIPAYAKSAGVELTINQSHGGSSSQARSVIDGLQADVVTLATWPDTEAIRKAGLIDNGWEKEFPNNSLPYISTIVFVVRKGNPKGIHDWADLAKPGIEIITPNPKTSGNGKLSFLAIWASVVRKGGSEADAKDFLAKVYKQAPVLDTGARGSTTTFAQKGIGDIQLSWENEAYLEVEEAGDLEIVYPKSSILAEPFVAVVDTNVNKKGTRAAATAYLNFLYTDEGQALIAKHHYRPNTEAGKARFASQFPAIELFPITEIAASWDDAQKRFFADGAIFDGIYGAGK